MLKMILKDRGTDLWMKVLLGLQYKPVSNVSLTLLLDCSTVPCLLAFPFNETGPHAAQDSPLP